MPAVLRWTVRMGSAVLPRRRVGGRKVFVKFAMINPRSVLTLYLFPALPGLDNLERLLFLSAPALSRRGGDVLDLVSRGEDVLKFTRLHDPLHGRPGLVLVALALPVPRLRQFQLLSDVLIDLPHQVGLIRGCISNR